MRHAYREDLSWIHDLGFGDLARDAADRLLETIAAEDLDAGLVVDLGCGTGILAEAVFRAGYEVLGIDLSPVMIEMARGRVPQGRFRCESLLTAELPPCVAVAAVGECFNYRFDASTSREQLRRLFRRIHESLEPGGILLFDAAGPGRVPGKLPVKTHVDGGDWVLLMNAEEDQAARRVTRCITSFRRVGDLFRRDDECHELDLLPEDELLADLAAAGFSTELLDAYSARALPAGLKGFLARRGDLA
jgi:SAM-dependent methyltransferase